MSTFAYIDSMHSHQQNESVLLKDFSQVKSVALPQFFLRKKQGITPLLSMSSIQCHILKILAITFSPKKISENFIK